MSHSLSFTAKRRMARENALKILYAVDMADHEIRSAIKDFFQYFYEGPDVEDIITYTDTLATGTEDKKKQIDETIEKFSENWTIERMVVIDRNILRTAVYEILFVEDVPILVSLNEAIEIGKIYGNNDSKRFINGILDKVIKTVKDD